MPTTATASVSAARFSAQQQGEPLNYFINPYAEPDGKPVASPQTHFSFSDLPAATQATRKWFGPGLLDSPLGPLLAHTSATRERII
jgi:hypothetical protein